MAWGGYLLAWTSGALVAALVGLWAVVQEGVDYRHGRASGRVCRPVIAAAVVALAVLLTFEQPGALRFGTRVAGIHAPLNAGDSADEMTSRSDR